MADFTRDEEWVSQYNSNIYTIIFIKPHHDEDDEDEDDNDDDEDLNECKSGKSFHSNINKVLVVCKFYLG